MKARWALASLAERWLKRTERDPRPDLSRVKPWHRDLQSSMFTVGPQPPSTPTSFGHDYGWGHCFRQHVISAKATVKRLRCSFIYYKNYWGSCPYKKRDTCKLVILKRPQGGGRQTNKGMQKWVSCEEWGMQKWGSCEEMGYAETSMFRRMSGLCWSKF